MSKSRELSTSTDAKIITPRFVVAVLLFVAGLAWIAYYYTGVRPDPAVPGATGSPKAIADLGKWNYLIGFGVAMLGLVVAAHPSTPLGRGRGVVVGMLACFLVGLVWICTYYVFVDDLHKIWVMNDLGSWNLVVGIALMGVGFSYATRWE